MKIFLAGEYDEYQHSPNQQQEELQSLRKHKSRKARSVRSSRSRQQQSLEYSNQNPAIPLNAEPGSEARRHDYLKKSHQQVVSKYYDK